MKAIKETKCTCKACGNIYYYGKTDELKYVGDSMADAGKALMCCSGCAPAAFIPDKKPIDPSKCPACKSSAVIKEEIIHYV